MENVLQWASVPLYKDGQCGHNPTDVLLMDTLVCAGGKGKESCNGDSGGPLVTNKGDGTAVVIGTVNGSFAAKCGDLDWPAYYAKTTYYLDWIKANMG